MLQLQMLVDARLYPNLDAVLQDALRALLQEKPQLRVELDPVDKQDARREIAALERMLPE
jgi:hypothetical protein